MEGKKARRYAMVFVPVKRKGLYCVVTIIVIVQKSILSWIVLISEFHWSGWLNWRCGTEVREE